MGTDALKAIERRSPERREALADLAAGSHDVKTIANRLGRSKWAVYKLRQRFEKAAGRDLPRHERRGRKPRARAHHSDTAANRAA